MRRSCILRLGAAERAAVETIEIPYGIGTLLTLTFGGKWCRSVASRGGFVGRDFWTVAPLRSCCARARVRGIRVESFFDGEFLRLSRDILNVMLDVALPRSFYGLTESVS